MQITRRSFIAVSAGGISAAAVTPSALGASSGPLLWSVRSDRGIVYLFGVDDANDRSWFSPRIRRAFEQSSALWLETPQTPSASSARLARDFGEDREHSLFDILGPRLSERTLRIAAEMGVPREKLEHVRPWAAFFIINNAFRQKFHVLVSADLPEPTLAELAEGAHKPVHTEFATTDDLVRLFMDLSDAAQREHVEDLLDFIDDEKAGLHKESYGWIAGHPDVRNIERMRRTRPALYQVMHVQRNKQWAQRISSLLSDGGVYFVCVGMNHMLGPDGIPRSLERIGISPSRV
jgi:uncharacterized protein YbaP (TraB family)